MMPKKTGYARRALFFLRYLKLLLWVVKLACRLQ